MAHIIKGLYKHNSGRLYNVIGTGRSVNSPTKLVVVYEQLYESNLRGTDILLPRGSLWT